MSAIAKAVVAAADGDGWITLPKNSVQRRYGYSVIRASDLILALAPKKRRSKVPEPLDQPGNWSPAAGDGAHDE